MPNVDINIQALEKATKAILFKNISLNSDQQKALIIFDEQCSLAEKIKDAYLSHLPHALCINFDQVTIEQLKAAIDTLKSHDVVILIQSTSFRVSNFRWRLELFHRNLAVIEHARLAYHTGEEIDIYIDSLADRYDYYQQVSNQLVPAINGAQKIVIACDNTELVYTSAMEEGKKNIGDYRGLNYVGGGFPIGEVFTEPKDFSQVNGSVMVYAYGNENHKVEFVKPFRLDIEKSLVTNCDGPPAFQKILAMLRTEVDDGTILVRELGFGLNNALSKTRRLTEVSAFERVQGIHMSLGRKHAVYRKKLDLDQSQQRYHIDIFVDVQRILIDDRVMYAENKYLT